MRKLLLLLITLVFTGLPMRCEIINDTLPPTSQLVDSLLLRASEGEEELNRPKIVLPSPQSQLFEKYVNHKISEYNGLPDITIPLYEIEVKGLKIPIALTYHASGIKYQQFDGEAGAGWSINAGGYRVSRTMYGRPDDLCDFYNEEEYAAAMASNDRGIRNGYLGRIGIDNNGDNGNDPRSTIIYRGGFSIEEKDLLDGEYDRFTYMLPSSSGHFIITDRDARTTSIAEPNRDRIQLGNFNHLIANSKLNDMQITDESGFQYLLGGAGYIETNNISEPRFLSYYNTAWMLKQIVTPYNESIDFSYNYSYVNPWGNDRHDFFAVWDCPTLENGIENFYYSIDVNNPNRAEEIREMVGGTQTWQNPPAINQAFIGEIVTDKEKITFMRDATGTYKYLLRKITIEDKSGNVLKEIELQYNKVDLHNLLQAVLVKNNSSTEKNYTFDYYDGSGNAMDQWGYYAYLQGKEYDYGDLFLHQEFAEGDVNTNAKVKVKVGTHYEPFRTAIGNNSSIWIDRKNLSHRIPNDYALQKIHYPTGGSTEYTYESNRYKDGNTTVYGAGLRIQEIKSNPEDGQPTVITRYKYGQNEDGAGVMNFDQNISEECFAKESCYLSYIEIPGTIGSVLAQFISKTYSTHPLIPEYADFSVFYNQVAIYRCEENSANTTGKIISEYTTPQQYLTSPYTFGASVSVLSYNLSHESSNRVVSNYLWGGQPLLISRKFLKNNTDTVKTETYSYITTDSIVYSGKKVEQPITAYQYRETNDCSAGNRDVYCDDMAWLFHWEDYYITLKKQLLNAKTEKLFTPQGIVTTTENYEYNAKNQLLKTTIQNSNNSNLITEYKYPWNYTTDIYLEMTTENMLSPVIEKITKQGTTETARIKTNYGKNTAQTKGLILPLSVQSAYQGSSFSVTEYTCDLYDEKGNIRQITGKDGILTTYLWGYKYQYPVAKIENATFEQVKTALGSQAAVDGIANADTLSNTQLNTLNNLRNLSNAMVTTYTYKPLVGIRTITDPRGVKTTYEYDPFGRLETIRDENNKIIEDYGYHYKN
ncbi:MAG: RHS repeat protein, partial [Candidatus Symbiothrix sp.]|nr:RHS repeat protein [Candidatus Symbiothrix sp.]